MGGPRNSNDWTVFGLSGDPVPGDTSSIQNVGQMLTARETAAYEVSVGINGLATDQEVNAWLGASGDAFRKTLEPVPGLLRQMVDAYNQAAAAVTKYASDLATAQHFADSAYQRRRSTIKDWQSKNPGKPLPAGGFPPLDVDLQQWDSEDYTINQGAIPARAQAAAACVKALQDAESTLRRVQSALGDPKFANFNNTYVANGGDLSQFTRPNAPVQVFGDVLENAEAADLTRILNGGKTDASPDVVRAELSDLTSEYQSDSAFWAKLGPSLGNVVDWIHTNKGPESTDASDQILINTLGQRTATAASNGSLSSLDVTGLGTASMVGLAKLLGTTKGSDYQNESGQDFLAFTTQEYIEGESGVDAWDRQNYDGALNTMLGLTSQNDAAARTLFAGSDGQHLVTELLTGEAQVTREQLAGRGGSITVTGSGYEGVDPKNVAALFDAARAPVDGSGVRGDDPASMDRLNAANNIIQAAAAFDHYSPSSSELSQVKGWSLPPQVTNSLEGYAKAYSFDLATSTTDSNNGAGITTVGGDPNGQPMFLVSSQQAHDFLDLSLKDPHAAGDYLGFAKAQFQNSVELDMASHGTVDHSSAYANLVATSQQIIDEQHMSGAKAQDAAAAQRAAIVNALLYSAGNAPGPDAVGVGQALDGLMTPYIEQLPGLQTNHAADMQVANHQADLLIGGKADIAVVQAAVDSGMLTVGDPGHDHLAPGILDANGHVQDNATFRSWYSEHQKIVVAPTNDPHLQNLSLEDYVSRMTRAMNQHS
ncbi:hypothetical protein Caci_8668 [Catenulispora acidiphila DSM 44928]|uniref:Putative T7SS secretion signal domain-containing protein n=1 Tax=Catenulispora acidiphila (strain DSM 44928 / JCM 14897 / NBRC 102108 / NRRL B-24433 / ID139908) TaxID=479433 RepID=C7Q0F0_CATAD|nr:hypothetical protein [Catenulispora acidiphila]ACU77483.1 hypothetical protein Caci_8668 [Catenulispora acidiphila DSM 44928]